MRICSHYKKKCPLKQGDAYCLNGDAHFRQDSEKCDKLIKQLNAKKEYDKQ